MTHMRTAVVTGAEGFIGRNLCLHLEETGRFTVIRIAHRNFEAEHLRHQLKNLGSVDVVFHLAGVNRTDSEDDFRTGNSDTTDLLCQILEDSSSTPLIFYASSTQANSDNPYGISKRQAEARLRAYSDRTGAACLIYRLPNVFGKWSRPNYNSVVATFCHNLTRGIDITIHDPSSSLTLLYIDDLCRHWIDQAQAEEQNVDEVGFGVLPVTYQTSVGELADKLRAISASRQTLVTERVGDGLLRALHATYLSYLPSEAFAYDLEGHVDQRGMFAEFLKTQDSGQFSFFTAHSGVVRGGHYHHSKTEKFLVVQGRATFRFRNVSTHAYHEIKVDAGTPRVVETVPGWIHDIRNDGTDLLVCLLWANEIFDRAKPDTIAKSVEDES